MLVLAVVALVAFVKEIFPIEVTALGFLAVLLATGTIAPEVALSGFSNKAVVAIGSLFVLSHALMKTGILERAAERLGARSQDRPWLGIGLLLLCVAVLSGFLNNTAIVALSIPLVMKLCRQLQMSPSKVLMPLSYASIFGGTLTLIGTSTNLLVGAIAQESGEPPLGFLEFTSLGAVFLVVGLLYTSVFARLLLPDRAEPGALTRKYRMGGYLTEVVVDAESKLVGRTVIEEGLSERYQVTVLELIRDGQHQVDVGRIPMQAGDLLIVQGGVDDLMRLRREQGVSLLPDIKLEDEELSAGGQTIAEVWVDHNSRLIGYTIQDLSFRQQFGGFVLAIRRLGMMLRTKIAHVKLRFSDSLLILIPPGQLEKLRQSDEMLVLSEQAVTFRRKRFWWLVFPVLPLVILLAATGVLDIASGALIGAVVLLLAGTISPQEAYRSINWSVIFLVAAFVPVGKAFVSTGTADFIAGKLLAASTWVPEGWAPYVALSTVYLATSVLTQMVSNNAAAVVLAPVALSLGVSLGVDPRPFLFAVCFAASAEFMTPMGYQTNLMVYGAGAYRFLDYTRFGAPLNLLFWLLATLLIPVFWPF